MAASKEYGLIKRGQKDNAVIRPRLSIFDEDDDSDEDGRKGVAKSLQREADKINSRKQVKLDLQSALDVDPSVFEYDAVYDDMVQKKKEEIGLKKKATVKKSRYIDQLLKAAKTRKLDQERATERKVYKERIAEGDKFADKEVFVTSAYKKKLQELEEEEVRERRQAEIDALTDVNKQKDLSGFYRQLYRQTLSPDKDVDKKEEDGVKKQESTLDDRDAPDKDERQSPGVQEIPSTSKRVQAVIKKPRQFRKQRKESETSSSSSSENDKSKDDHKRLKDNSGKKRKINESKTTLVGSNDEAKVDKKKEPSSSSSARKGQQCEPSAKQRMTSSSEDCSSNEGSSEFKEGKKGKEKSSRQKSNKEFGGKSDNEDKKNKEELPKISARDKLLALFKKRNFGEAFDQARQRYLARREARNVEKLI